MEAQLEYYIHIAYTFMHVWRRFICPAGAYQQYFGVRAQSEECIVGWVVQKSFPVSLVFYYYVLRRKRKGKSSLNFFASISTMYGLCTVLYIHTQVSQSIQFLYVWIRK